jgi:transcriptional regulator with XRE-family HTH domain
MNEDKEEVQRLLGVLRTLMRMVGVSNREIERRLELHPSSLTRFFNGQVEAKLELVLGITRALGLEYNELFSFAYPERQMGPESAAAQKIRSLLDGLAPPKKRTPAPAPAAAPKAQDDVQSLLRELLAKMQAAGSGD